MYIQTKPNNTYINLDKFSSNQRQEFVRNQPWRVLVLVGFTIVEGISHFLLFDLENEVLKPLIKTL
jgi:hypothetical protein